MAWWTIRLRRSRSASSSFTAALASATPEEARRRSTMRPRRPFKVLISVAMAVSRNTGANGQLDHPGDVGQMRFHQS